MAASIHYYVVNSPYPPVVLLITDLSHTRNSLKQGVGSQMNKKLIWLIAFKIIAAT